MTFETPRNPGNFGLIVKRVLLFLAVMKYILIKKYLSFEVIVSDLKMAFTETAEICNLMHNENMPMQCIEFL